jgi:hypothetical protein
VNAFERTPHLRQFPLVSGCRPCIKGDYLQGAADVVIHFINHMQAFQHLVLLPLCTAEQEIEEQKNGHAENHIGKACHLQRSPSLPPQYEPVEPQCEDCNCDGEQQCCESTMPSPAGKTGTEQLTHGDNAFFRNRLTLRVGFHRLHKRYSLPPAVDGTR